MFLVVGSVEAAVGALIEVTVFFPVSQLVIIGAERPSAVSFGYCFEVSKEGQSVYLVEAFDDIGLEGFSLFFIGVLVLVFDEVPVGAVEGEHQTMKFTVSNDGGLEVWVSEQLSKFEGLL